MFTPTLTNKFIKLNKIKKKLSQLWILIFSTKSDQVMWGNLVQKCIIDQLVAY